MAPADAVVVEEDVTVGDGAESLECDMSSLLGS